MSALIFILGLAIGISAFLYMVSLISGGMKKIQDHGSGQSKIIKQNIEPQAVGYRGRNSIPPGARICPLCGSELTKYEGLYATKISENSEYKILIMGCKYCYKDK